MKERLREINDSLRKLDAAHRHGHIQRDDYRARRRHLLSMLCDSDGITARNTITARTVPRGQLRQAANVSAASLSCNETVPATKPWWLRWLPWGHRS